MISNISFILAALTLGTPALLLVMLLPTLVELRSPRDSGPRIIIPDFSEAVPILGVKAAHLQDIDEKFVLDCSLTPFLNVILDIMPNIDA